MGIRHIRALDGLRGVAVLAVLLFHSDLLVGGYLGVDLFFVLSGFLITSLLLVEAQATGGIGVLGFWARRARRLLPALFLVIGAVALYAAIYAEPWDLTRIRGDAFATLGYVANWRFVFRNVDYWAQFSQRSPLEHTWSLAIEEQFYVIWPLVVLGVTEWTRRRGAVISDVARRVFWLSGLLTLAGAMWALWIWTNHHDQTRIYFGTDTRSPAILIGSAFAAWTQWRGPIHSRRGRSVLEIAAGLGALFLALAWFQLDGDRLFRGGLLACSVAALVVLAAAAHPRPGFIARVMSNRLLVGLGIISYGLYLWHWPIYFVLDADRLDLTGWPLFGVRFAVTIVVALASYALVEHPIRRGAGSPRNLAILTPLLAAALIGATIVATAGAIDLTPGPQVLPDPKRVAQRAERSGALRVMVAGNSVANALADEGFSQVVSEPPIVVLNNGIFSCDFPTAARIRTEIAPEPAPPVSCTTPWRAAVAEFDPEVVILVFGDVHVTDYEFVDGWASQCDPGFGANYQRALDRAVEELGGSGARVVLTTAAFTRLFMPQAFSDRVQAATVCTNRLLKKYAAAHPRVELVDVNAFMCPEGGECRTEIGGAPVRPDGVHYRAHGAQVVAAWVLTELGMKAKPSS